MKLICSVARTLMVAATLAAASAAAAAPGLKATWKDITDQYRTELTAEGIVGSSLAISQDGRPLHVFHYGLADQASGRPVNDDTLYHWASITKLFTAIAVMQLRDRGKLSLDDRIIDYLPETKQVHNRFGPMSAITLRHLITHSSGFRDRTFPWRGDEDWQPLEPAKWSQIAAMMPYSQIEFEPGTRYGYSNVGITMLGRVVEEISGDDLEVYITKNILMPLGMTRSYFDTTPLYLQRHRSSSYLRNAGVLRDLGPELDSGATHANSGLNGPVADLLKFGHFLLGANDNGNYDAVLSRKTLAEMWEPRLVAYDTPTLIQHIGYTFELYEPRTETKSPRVIGHTGEQRGFRSFFHIHPESRSVIIGAMNTITDRPIRETAYTRVRRNIVTKALPALPKPRSPR